MPCYNIQVLTLSVLKSLAHIVYCLAKMVISIMYMGSVPNSYAL